MGREGKILFTEKINKIISKEEAMEKSTASSFWVFRKFILRNYRNIPEYR